MWNNFETKQTLQADPPLDTTFQNGFPKHELSLELHALV